MDLDAFHKKFLRYEPMLEEAFQQWQQAKADQETREAQDAEAMARGPERRRRNGDKNPSATPREKQQKPNKEEEQQEQGDGGSKGGK